MSDLCKGLYTTVLDDKFPSKGKFYWILIIKTGLKTLSQEIAILELT